MKTYLIGIDLDGTLLNKKSKISLKTKNYIKELSKLGHKVVIVTGRPYRGTKHFYDELELNTPLVVDNGAFIVGENCNSFKTFRKSISLKHLKNIFNFSKENIVATFFSVYNNLYVYNYLDEIDFFYHLNENTVIHETDFNVDWLEEPANFSINVKGQFADEFESFIKHKTNGEINFRTWFKDEEIAVYEVFPKGYNKGTAFNQIREFYNIPHQRTITFGDGYNDLELLEVAFCGVKMKNGVDALDNYKNDTTKHTNDNDGVIKYLQDFFK